MIRQVSAWGQFWFDLFEQHNIHRCGITTPLQTNRQPFRKAYYAVWFRNGVYKTIEGDTMYEMMRNGLEEFGVNTMSAKVNLLACVLDDLAYRFSGCVR